MGRNVRAPRNRIVVIRIRAITRSSVAASLPKCEMVCQVNAGATDDKPLLTFSPVAEAAPVGELLFWITVIASVATDMILPTTVDTAIVQFAALDPHHVLVPCGP